MAKKMDAAEHRRLQRSTSRPLTQDERRSINRAADRAMGSNKPESYDSVVRRGTVKPKRKPTR